MAHNDRMKYFITNNVEAIMNILIRHELLDLEPNTPLSSNFLFQYENACS